MRTSGWHGRLAVAFALLAALVVAAPAGAATSVRLAGGTTSLKLDAKTAKALKRAGINISATKPAKSRGGALAFPIAGGAIDPATAKGTVAHKGGLTLKMGKTKVALDRLSLNTRKGTISAKSGKKTLALGSLKGGKVSRNGFDTSVAGVKVRLGKPAAATLNRAFGVKAFKAGLTLGTASVASRAAEIALVSGTTTLTFTPTAQGALAQMRVQVAPIAPTTADPATGALKFPVTGGTLDADSLAGTIAHSGGLSLAPQGAAGLDLTQVRVAISASPTLTVNLGPIADLDLSRVTREVDAAKRTIALDGVGIKLNAIAATTLNGLFGVEAFAAGTEIATASLTAQAR